MERIRQPEIVRDRWGKPIIGGKTYSRASSLSIDDKSGLIAWKGKDVLRQIQENPAILHMKNPWEHLDNSGGSGYGTAVHACLEGLLYEEIPAVEVTEEHIRDATAALNLIHTLGLTPVASEIFVVNNHVDAAGTFDLLLADNDGNTLIGDLKTTGKPNAEKWSANSWATQTAIYANAKPINEAGDIVEWEAVGLTPPILDEALIINVIQKTGIATALAVNITHGWTSALMAADIRDHRNQLCYRHL